MTDISRSPPPLLIAYSLPKTGMALLPRHFLESITKHEKTAEPTLPFMASVA